MLNFFKGKKNKNDKESNRVIQTKIQTINTDDPKSQAQGKVAGPKKVKFQIDVEYHTRGWKIDRTLEEFVDMRSNLYKSRKGNVPAFALLPYGATSSKHKDKKFPFSQNKSKNTRPVTSTGDLANAEAPFLREMRVALDTWLDTIVLDPDLHTSNHLTSFLDWQRHKSVSQAPIIAEHATVKKKQSISVDDFVLLKVLGKGSFGKVLLVRKSDDSNIYAMKTLRKQRVFQRHQVEHTQTERRVLGYLKHPFLVSLHYAFQTDQKLFLVLDYAAGGELFFHLSKAGRFTEERTRFYIAEIVLAIEFLHSKDIIYRDLKPENILLDSEGHVKITDFGLCKENVPDNHTARSFCGTPEYLAPEILRKVGHGKAADWWTLGALIYEMLCGVPPFYSRSRDKLFEKILKQKIRFPNYFSHDAKDIIRLLMQRNPKSRLGAREGASEVKVHVFFTGIDWDRLYKCDLEPPFRPRLNKDKHGVMGGTNFDPEFTGMPIHSPEESKRKYAPFEDFTFLGHDDDFDLGGNDQNDDAFPTNNGNNNDANIESADETDNDHDDHKYDN